jgi:hypothetical protein
MEQILTRLIDQGNQSVLQSLEDTSGKIGETNKDILEIVRTSVI